MLKEPTKEEIDLQGQNTEEIQEIISYKPHWVVRKGIAIFFLLLLILLSISCFVKYPDIVKGSIRLVSLNAPKQINARSEGRLEKLLVQNEQHVTRGLHLAYLQSTGSHEQVAGLQTWVERIVVFPEEKRLQYALGLTVPAYYILGEIQPAFQQFQSSLLELKQLWANGYYEQKKALLKKELSYIATLQANGVNQLNLLQEDLKLQKQEYKAKETLLKEKVIAPLEFNQDKSKLIGKEQTLQQIQSNLINTNLSYQLKEKELVDLEKAIFDRTQQFHYALAELKSKIEEWMQKYVVVASEDGKLLFASTLEINQLLYNNQELFYIQPQQSSYYGELMAGQRGLGKIKPHQRVLIKIDSYPYSEFGYVSGNVEYISRIPSRRDSFIVKINLPDGLNTNMNKSIFFRNNLSGTGEIVTNERTLFQRILGDITVAVGER